MKKQNGKAGTWTVKYLDLRSEMHRLCQMGHQTVDDYGKFALKAAKLMRWADLAIKMTAPETDRCRWKTGAQ